MWNWLLQPFLSITAVMTPLQCGFCSVLPSLSTHTQHGLCYQLDHSSPDQAGLKAAVFVFPATSLLPSIAKCKWSRRQMRKGQWTLIKHLFFIGTPGFIVLCLIALRRCYVFLRIDGLWQPCTVGWWLAFFPRFNPYLIFPYSHHIYRYQKQSTVQD